MKNFKEEYNIALAGNPNAGKTSTFNAITGEHQHVGNWPGVTVEKKEGFFILNDVKVNVVDIPGIYSLTAYSLDEIVARDYILKGNPDMIVDIVDASNLKRNLYLLIQLLETGKKTMAVFNMMDIVKKKNLEIDTKAISKSLRIPIITLDIDKNKKSAFLKENIVEMCKKEYENNFKIDYKPVVNDAIDEIIEILEEKGFEFSEAKRWVAIKILENSEEYLKRLEKLEYRKEIFEIIEKTEKRIEKEYGMDTESFIVERRYGFITGLLHETFREKHSIKDRIDFSDKVDAVVTNKYVGIPIFLVIMWLMFQSIFTLGQPLVDIIDKFFELFSSGTASLLVAIHSPAWLVSLVTDGIINGAGSVAVFLPNILILYFFMALLEDTGYMSRVAFIMDKFMHFLGLHGKSFIPMILGFGCNVPAITATRTLESRKDRILTIVTIPFMSCSARLPIYVLFAGAFFKKDAGMVVFSLYILGILLAVLSARVLKNMFFKNEIAPLIMEMPPYHMPQWGGIFLHAWRKGLLYLQKIATVVVIGVIGIWFLSSMPFGVKYASAESWLGKIGDFLAPVFSSAGFGYWQIAVALIFGILAKELVVGTLGTVLIAAGSSITLSQALHNYFTPLSAYAFLVLTLVYVPCVATVAAIKNEAGWKWALFSTIYSLLLGWGLATLIYQIGSLF